MVTQHLQEVGGARSSSAPCPKQAETSAWLSPCPCATTAGVSVQAVSRGSAARGEGPELSPGPGHGSGAAPAPPAPGAPSRLSGLLLPLTFGAF